MAQAHAKALRQLAGDLLGAPLLFGQQRLDLGIDLRRVVLDASTSSSASIGLLLGLAGYVERVRLALVVGRVAPDPRLNVLGLRPRRLAMLRSDSLSRL